MKPINYHTHDLAELAELAASERQLLERGIGIMIEKAETRPLALNIRNSLWIAGALAATEPSSDEMCTALRGVAAKSAGLFRLMIEAPGEYPIPLGDGRRAILHNIGVTSETNAGVWQKGFYAACIARDAAALDQLARIPVRDLRRSSTRADDCMFLWVEALQSWHLGASGTAATLHAALEATDPSRLTVSGGGAADYVLNILVPNMELLLRLIEGQSTPFDDAMEYALVRHKKYWSGAKKQTDPEGFLALGPLAFASLAHDVGMTVAIESDYLPPRIYEGACRVGG